MRFYPLFLLSFLISACSSGSTEKVCVGTTLANSEAIEIWRDYDESCQPKVALLASSRCGQYKKSPIPTRTFVSQIARQEKALLTGRHITVSNWLWTTTFICK